MKRLLLACIAILGFSFLSAAHAENVLFTFSGEWVDDYAGPSNGYAGVYSYQIRRGVQIETEVIDSTEPVIDYQFAGDPTTNFFVVLRNGNGLIPVGNTNRYGPWTDPIPVVAKGLPVPVATHNIRLIADVIPPPPPSE